MPKLRKICYYTSKGEKKLNSYNFIISKKQAGIAGFNDTMQLVITAEKGRIIIEREKQA